MLALDAHFFLSYVYAQNWQSSVPVVIFLFSYIVFLFFVLLPGLWDVMSPLR